MYVPTLTTHNEKVQFLTNFLNGSQQGFDRNQPLMIAGSGGNGKSKVFSEVAPSSPVNILLLNEDYSDKFRVWDSNQPTDKYATLMIALGTDQEYELAQKLNAQIVQFAKDPAYS
jgi:hypothetical protein